MIGPEIKADLYGMDDYASLAKMQGGEYGLIWLEEPAPIVHAGNAGIRHEVFLICARRIAAGGNMAKRLQISMNPADKGHWTYKEAVKNPFKSTEVFWIKPGDNPHISQQDREARAEVFRNRPDLSARYDAGKFSEVYAGVAITPEYNEEIHLAKKTLLPVPGGQFFRFWDGGLTPACVIAEITPSGNLLFLDCVAGKNVGMRQLIEGKVLPLLNLPRYVCAKGSRQWRDIGDASLDNREQSDSEHRAAHIINTLLNTSFEQGIQQWEPRKEALKDCLSRLIDGQAFVQINPRITEGEPFNRVQQAFAGAYSYPVGPTGIVTHDGPDKKQEASHVGDAISHGLARLFFRATDRQIQYNPEKSLQRVRGYGVRL